MKNQIAENLLKSLINIESLSGKESKVLSFIEKLLRKEQFEIKHISVTQKTYCLLATVGKAKVILQAHVDTVPPFISFSENERYIFGRGACDTKGSVATMITAAIEAKRKGISNFGVLFTVEEETSFLGAIAAAKVFENQLPYFIVGEPSSLKPVTSHFGIKTFTIIASGKAAHTSMPESGINAIDLLMGEGYEKLKELKLGEETLSAVVQISGGTAPNIVPAEAQLIFSMRIAPGDTKNYFDEIERLVSPCLVQKGEFLAPVKSILPTQLQFLGTEQTARYCTELSFFRNGCILGPGSIKHAHARDERVSKAELARAVTLYVLIIEAFQ